MSDMVWTPFGFGRRRPGFSPCKSVCVELRWGRVYLQPKDVHTKVRVQFAVFAGHDLKTWSLEVRADEQLESLRVRAAADSPVKKQTPIRLVLYGDEISPTTERLCDLDLACRPLPIEILCILENGTGQEKSLLRDIRNFLQLASSGVIIQSSP